MKNTEKTMDKIVALCKNRGFIFAGSEIYGGLANTWDYGPLGVELKNNVKKAWWQKFVQENRYNVGLDAAILMNPQTWVASGHLGGFSDPLMDCRECHERFRADKVIEDWCKEVDFDLPKPIDAYSQAEMKAFIEEHTIPCPSCGISHMFIHLAALDFKSAFNDNQFLFFTWPLVAAEIIFIIFRLESGKDLPRANVAAIITFAVLLTVFGVLRILFSWY